MTVAFVGIGNMGWPMAANLRKAGHELLVFDAAPGLAAQFATKHGCRAALSVAELAGVDIVVTMLPNGQIVRDLYFKEALASLLQPGALAIDMSSADPTGTRQLGARLAERGVILVDAPVSGAVPRAIAGTLAIMIGSDDAAATARAKAVLAAMGDRLFETGGLGTGHAMKALNNIVARPASRRRPRRCLRVSALGSTRPECSRSLMSPPVAIS